MTAWLIAGVMFAAASAQAGRVQPPTRIVTVELDGHVAILADVVPRQDALELRPELRLDLGGRFGADGRVRFGVDVLAQGLSASRAGQTVTAATFRPRDAWIEVGGRRGDLRAGYGRVIWGRLDEVQPSDVINPIDASKLLLDSRAAARLPVWFARARVVPSDRITAEAVLLPVFRRGTFDELDEASSPFNLVRTSGGFAAAKPATASIAGAVPPGLDVPVERVEPGNGWATMSGGGRASITIGRVDVAAAVFRGFEPFGVVWLEVLGPGAAPPGLVLRERHTRFTMIAGDAETVVGDWAVRGEAAWFAERMFAGVSRPGLVRGRALDAGVGFDRRAGDLRVFGTVLVRRQWSGEDAAVSATDVSLVGSVERAFGRDRYRARAFAVVNPCDAAGFVRGLFSWSVRDNVTLEASAAAFLGDGDDLLSRFSGRDFGFTRFIVYF